MIAIIASTTNSFESYIIKDVVTIKYIDRECHFVTKDNEHYAYANDKTVVSFA